MSSVYTIGYQGKLLAEFITLLQKLQVDAIVDIRCARVPRRRMWRIG